MARYIAAVKAKYPSFEITSNWMYTHTMPEKRVVPIDFISGDYNCTNAVNEARVVARCIVPQALTWDLMAWGQQALPCSWENMIPISKPENYNPALYEIVIRRFAMEPDLMLKNIITFTPMPNRKTV